MGFREQAVLDAGAGSGGHHSLGDGVLSLRDSFVYLRRRERWRLGFGRRTESNHLPIPFFCGIGGAGDGHFELFSCIRAASRDAHLLECCVDHFLDGGGVEILQKPGDVAGGGCAGRGSLAVSDTGAATGAQRDEV